MWKQSPCNTTQGQKVIRNRANSRAKKLLQHRSLTAKEFFSVLGKKSLLFARQHSFLCLPHVGELCGLSARCRRRPGCHVTALQPSLSFSPLPSGLPGGPLIAAVGAAWGRPVSAEGGQGRLSQYWSTLPGFSALLLMLQPIHHTAMRDRDDKAPESP